jgi:fucose permease
MGLGFGLSSISVNSLAATLIPSRPGFVLNLCNVWYAVGSVAGPLLASVVLARGGRAVDVLLVAGTFLLVLVPVAWWLVPGRASGLPPAPAFAAGDARRRWRPSPALLMISVLVLLYAGVEAGFGGWASSYVQQTIGASPARGALLTSMFWFSYLVGRMVATVATLTVRPGQILAATTSVIAVGGFVLGLGHGQSPPTIVAIALLGFGVGPVYPAMFALVTSRFTDRPATAVSVTASIGSIGAVALPWLMGRALPYADGLVVAWMPAAYGVGMLAALWMSQILYRRQT